MDVENKTAVVTGGASGIGKAIAAALIERGGRVVIADIDETALREAVADLGKQAEPLVCNVRDPQSIEKLADDSWALLGGVDLAFANAGLGPGAPLLQATVQQFDVIYEVNIRGSWLTCAAFGRRMAAAGRAGHLCVTGSEHSLGMQHAMLGHYTASKHAVLGWADVMRHELPESITISVLCPGIVNTRLHDSTRGTELPPADQDTLAMGIALMNRGMDAADVAAICLRGIADNAFIIPTHASSRHAAQRRWQEIDGAFAAFAPPGSASEKYEMNRILAETMALFTNRAAPLSGPVAASGEPGRAAGPRTETRRG